jgi:hypothetical protein
MKEIGMAQSPFIHGLQALDLEALVTDSQPLGREVLQVHRLPEAESHVFGFSFLMTQI